LKYLYYALQVGISLSPLSNAALYLDSYHDHPLKNIIELGLNVTLSSDDPLIFHDENPLREEYQIAKNSFKLKTSELLEMAAKSVFLSGFPFKYEEITKGLDERLKFRRQTLDNELKILFKKGNSLILFFFSIKVNLIFQKVHQLSKRQIRKGC
jgi:AMP deaminase